jgi:hypothetical protein
MPRKSTFTSHEQPPVRAKGRTPRARQATPTRAPLAIMREYAPSLSHQLRALALLLALPLRPDEGQVAA